MPEEKTCKNCRYEELHALDHPCKWCNKNPWYEDQWRENLGWGLCQHGRWLDKIVRKENDICPHYDKGRCSHEPQPEDGVKLCDLEWLGRPIKNRETGCWE